MATPIDDPFEEEEAPKRKTRTKKTNGAEPKPIKRSSKKAVSQPGTESGQTVDSEEPEVLLDQTRSAGKLEIGIGDPGAGSAVPFWLRQNGYQPAVWDAHA